MLPKTIIFSLILIPFFTSAQTKFIKTWDDKVMKSRFTLQLDDSGKAYVFEGEKYQSREDFGKLATGPSDRIKQVVAQMDSAFQSKDPDQLFALGRYKYTYKELEFNDLLTVEALQIEDLLKDKKGNKPVYMMSAATLEKIKSFIETLE